MDNSNRVIDRTRPSGIDRDALGAGPQYEFTSKPHQLFEAGLSAWNTELWSEFIRCSQPLIARVVIKTVRRWTRPASALVDDLVQETYLKLCANNFKALREFDCSHENAFYGFLKVVASHVVHDHFRGSYSQKRGSGRDDQGLEALSVADAGSSVVRIERGILLREISECLEARVSRPNFSRDCAIFWMYYVQGQTANEIAELPAIGLSVKGVESTILRLTRLVREGLTGKASDDD